MMKLLVLIAVMLSASMTLGARPQLGDDLIQAIQRYHQKCVEETKVDEEHIDKANAGVFIREGNLNCYLKCITTKLEIMDEQGNISGERVEKKLPDFLRPHLRNVIEICKPQADVQKNLCDKAFELHVCVHKVDPNSYFVP